MKVAELAKLITSGFIRELYQEDQREAERVKAEGCLHCGGRLHRANYPRKGRGIVEVLPELESRESFCCAECRKRRTPESVRFLGRKVYLAVCLVVAGVLRGEGETVAKTCSLIGMSAETLRRWTRWWAGPVQKSRWWRVARARIMPPLEGRHFVGELFLRLLTQAKRVETAILKLLKFVSPLTVPAQYPS